jgi:hypothetical protein
MKNLYYQDKKLVFYPGIPYLVDRTMLSSKRFDHNAKQLYGTQGWTIKNEDGSYKSAAYPIKDKKNLLKRRKIFDLSTSPGTVKNCKHQT